MPRVLLIFVDGVGIGSCDPATNPFARIAPTVFRQSEGAALWPVHGGGLLKATDASLSVAGLPQSATGQTAILTGANAAALLGHHLSGLPNPTLKALLARESIFIKLRSAGRTATFANAYQPRFFSEGPLWISATTAACLSAGIRLRTLTDLERGDAVYHDFTQDVLRRAGCDVPLRSPEEAGRNLARLASAHDFTLYEHFLTDFLGHAQDMEGAVRHIEALERFVRATVDAVDPRQHLVLLTSDHGNLEDLSRRTHTSNPVPTIAWGSGARQALERIRSIQDVTPALLSALASAAS